MLCTQLSGEASVLSLWDLNIVEEYGNYHALRLEIRILVIFRDPFQPLIRIKYPSSLTLFDGLVIKLISRVSWSEYSLLCAHTLCNTISSLAKVSLTKQTRDKKELCEKCSTCRDRVGKELMMNSIFWSKCIIY